MIKSLFTNSDYNKRFLKILKIKKLRDVKPKSPKAELVRRTPFS